MSARLSAALAALGSIREAPENWSTPEAAREAAQPHYEDDPVNLRGRDFGAAHASFADVLVSRWGIPLYRARFDAHVHDYRNRESGLVLKPTHFNPESHDFSLTYDLNGHLDDPHFEIEAFANGADGFVPFGFSLSASGTDSIGNTVEIRIPASEFPDAAGLSDLIANIRTRYPRLFPFEGGPSGWDGVAAMLAPESLAAIEEEEREAVTDAVILSLAEIVHSGAATAQEIIGLSGPNIAARRGEEIPCEHFPERPTGCHLYPVTVTARDGRTFDLEFDTYRSEIRASESAGGMA